MIQVVSNNRVGNGTMYLGSKIRGRILAIKAVTDSSVQNPCTLTITGETTGIGILTDATVANSSTVWWHPRALAADSSDGSAATDAFVEIPVYKERIQVVVTAAGITGTVTVTVYYDSEE